MQDPLSVSKRAPTPEVIPLLTADEVAKQLGVKRSAVYNLCYKPGSLRAYKVGGRVRFKREEVETYIRRTKSAPPGDSNT
jgi:excisionase family DNA binding protein